MHEVDDNFRSRVPSEVLGIFSRFVRESIHAFIVVDEGVETVEFGGLVVGFDEVGVSVVLEQLGSIGRDRRIDSATGGDV